MTQPSLSDRLPVYVACSFVFQEQKWGHILQRRVKGTRCCVCSCLHLDCCISVFFFTANPLAPSNKDKENALCTSTVCVRTSPLTSCPSVEQKCTEEVCRQITPVAVALRSMICVPQKYVSQDCLHPVRQNYVRQNTATPKSSSHKDGRKYQPPRFRIIVKRLLFSRSVTRSRALPGTLYRSDRGRALHSHAK